MCELDVLKDITIAALSRDILPLSALYEPEGAISKAAAESEQPRWCIKVRAKARRVARGSAEPRLTKKEVFDMVMASTLDGKVQVRVPVPSGGMKIGCPEHRGCLWGCRKTRDVGRFQSYGTWMLSGIGVADEERL